MAQYEVKGPDGQIHLFAGPDGATPDQVVAAAQQIFGAAHQQAQKQTDAWASTINPVDGMSTTDRMLAGVGKAFADVGRGVGQLIPGLVSRQDVTASRAQDAPLMATAAGKVGDALGNLAIATPAALIPGAGTVLGGAATGAVMGLLQPSASTSETVKNIALGGAAGGLVPAAVQGLKTVKAAAEPFYSGGQNNIVGRALNRAAGSDAPAVAQRLQDAAEPFVGPSQGTPRTIMGELVPSSIPTVGQASGNAGVASLEHAAVAVNPEMTNAMDNIVKAQNAARVGVLQDLAGTDAARTAADAARQSAAAPLYQQATQANYTVDPQLANLLQRPAVQQAMERAKVMAANDGRPFTFQVESRTGLGSLGNQTANNTTQVTGQGLQDLKMALDAMLSDPTSGFAGKAGRQVADLRDQIVQWMEKANPEFRAARQTYSAMSQPVNQMDVARAIADKAISPLTGNMKPASYARALADEGLPATATGFPAATYDNSVSNAAQNQLQSVLQDVQRSTTAQNAARGIGSDTVKKLAYANILDQSGVPTVIRSLSPAQVVGNLAGRAADAAYGRANRELSNRLAQVMLDPGEAAQLMFAARPKPTNAMLKALTRAAQVGALSVPPTMNAQQLP